MSVLSAVQSKVFGTLPDGREVRIFTLENARGLKARVMEYGAILVSLEVPDGAGKMADVTHGFDSLEGWLVNAPYFGATIGRFGNRIAHGRFSLAGEEYELVTNNEPGGLPCHLHGGSRGFDKVLWEGRVTEDGGVEFTYLSRDGEEGYPGNLRVKVTYTLTDEDELKWEVEATTDATTIVNVVHHTYWNLSGNSDSSIEDHVLNLNAPFYLPTDVGLIPTGEIAPVAGTPMDFTSPRRIGERMREDFEALKVAEGYDHAWVIEEGSGVRLAAVLKEPTSGRVMELFTDQAAVQVYCAIFLDGTSAGKGGACYPSLSAVCLETEGFPDAPNQAHFPSCVLQPGEVYRHVMIHRFSAE